MSEEELDMNELINSFDEYSTDYTKTACTYYGDYLRNYQKEKLELQDRINKAVEYIENNSLYDEEYDYNYEEEMYLSGIDDEVAKKDLLSLLKGDKE